MASVEGILGNAERQVHEFKWNRGGEITLDFTHPDGGGDTGHPVELKLYDVNNNEIARLTARGNTQLTASVPAEGTYYLSVRDADFSSKAPGAYTFTSTFTSAPNTTYDGGANNSVPTALWMPVTDVARGRLERSDIDVFRVELDAGGMFRLRFSHPNGQGADGALVRLRVTDEAGNVVALDDVRGDGLLETTVPTAGNYYFSVGRVFSEEADPRLYTVAPIFSTYKDVVYDAPRNNNPAEAQSLPLGQTAIGRLDAADADYYRFDASSAGKLTLRFTHPEGAGAGGRQVTLELADSTGQKIITKTERGSDLFSVDLPNGGSYTVKIADPFHGETPGYYSLMLGLANNSGQTIVLDKAGTFAGTSGNDVVHGSTGRDVMTFTGNAAQYQVAVSPSGATVFDTSGAQGLDTLFNVERLQFADKMVALDVQGVAGQVFRLYEAAFNRPADAKGLGFWIHQLDNGMRLHDVAAGFIDSDEFRSIYGGPRPEYDKLVESFYLNILGREPDDAGIDYWVRLLKKETVDRADVLIAIANSEENVAQLVGVMMKGLEYEAWGG